MTFQVKLKLLSTGKTGKGLQLVTTAGTFLHTLLGMCSVKCAHLHLLSMHWPRFHLQRDNVNQRHGINAFYFFPLSIFSIVIIHMPLIANPEPSEVQQCATATQLTRLLILETTLEVWLPFKKHTNCYLLLTFDVV